MEIDIKVVDGVLEFKALHVITESQHNKITAGINKPRIARWCDDNYVSTDTERSIQCMCIMTQVRTEVDTNTISEMERKMHEFLMFVDDLPEIDSQDDKVNTNDLEFVKTVGSNEHIVGAILMEEIDKDLPFCVNCGRISGTLLKELFALYIEKYEHKNN